jgi:hypothetical protein
MERSDLRGIELAGGSSRIDSGSPKRLVGVNVADAREGSLVEEGGLDRSAPPCESFRQLGRRKAAVERLSTETRREVRV